MTAPVKVWLVWTGEYSDASVVGVYSTLELAEAAANMHSGPFSDKSKGWVDDGYDVDADAVMVRAGYSRWRIDIRVDDGAITWIYSMHPGTGAPPSVVRERLPPLYDVTGPIIYGVTEPIQPARDSQKLRIECDAKDKEHAVKIAGDERKMYLATAPAPL